MTVVSSILPRRDSFLSEYCEFFQKRRVIQRLNALHDLLARQTEHINLPKPARDNSRLVVPFHPSLIQSGFISTVRSIQEDFVQHSLGHFKPLLSWKRHARNLRETCANIIVTASTT